MAFNFKILTDTNFVTGLEFIDIERFPVFKFLHTTQDEGLSKRRGVHVGVADFIEDEWYCADVVQVAMREKPGFDHSFFTGKISDIRNREVDTGHVLAGKS